MKKFSLTKSKKDYFGTTLYQIKAEMSFNNVVKGELGGWIEKKENLNEDGNAWVYGNARVSGNAWVSGNAQVSGDAWVYGNAQVYGNAWVSGNAQVYGDAWVYGNAQVYGDAWVYGNAQVSDNARVYGKLKLLAGYFFGIRYKNEEIKYVKVDDENELIYKGEAKFGESEDDEVANAIKLLKEKGKLKDGKILIN